MSASEAAVDIYPMPSFVVLQVRDLAASSRWYQEALGFQHVFSIPPVGEPMLVHLRWAKYADLLLRRELAPSDAAKGLGISLNFNLSSGSVDDLANRAREYGAKIVSEPTNQPWNARDFTVQDPDGFRLTFTQGPVEKELGMDEIIARSKGWKQD